jgi:predicted membrane channel-forming protein YqfA (hemolysin III family)
MLDWAEWFILGVVLFVIAVQFFVNKWPRG